jgi:hypothetical protein
MLLPPARLLLLLLLLVPSRLLPLVATERFPSGGRFALSAPTTTSTLLSLTFDSTQPI